MNPLHIQIVFPYKDSSPTGLELSRMISFKLDDLLKTLPPNKSHPQVLVVRVPTCLFRGIQLNLQWGVRHIWNVQEKTGVWTMLRSSELEGSELMEGVQQDSDMFAWIF